MYHYQNANPEIAVFRTELKYLNDKYHENSVQLARFDVLLDTLRKNVHTLKGMQEILNSTSTEYEKKLSAFDIKFEFSKTKIIDDLQSINDNIQKTNYNLELLNEKIMEIEESSKFKTWLWKIVLRNYKVLGWGIVVIGFFSILLYKITGLPPLIKFIQ